MKGSRIDSLFTKRQELGRASRRLLGGAAALALLLGSADAAAKVMSVRVDEANFRAGPSTSHEVLFTAIRYYPVKILDKTKEGWAKVQDFEGDQAWVAERLLSPDPTVIVAVERANLREKGDIHSRVVGKVERSQVFRVVKRDGRWLQLAGDKETLGWIREDLVWGDQSDPTPKPRAKAPETASPAAPPPAAPKQPPKQTEPPAKDASNEAPADKPADKPADTSESQPAEEPGAPPSNQPSDKPSNKPSDKPSDKPADQPGEPAS